MHIIFNEENKKMCFATASIFIIKKNKEFFIDFKVKEEFPFLEKPII